eukprot:scaffold317063_cov29-Prasinocladus_malaysianus.AAC.1
MIFVGCHASLWQAIGAFGATRLETQITVRSGTHSAMQVFRDVPVPVNGTPYFTGAADDISANGKPFSTLPKLTAATFLCINDGG